MSWILGNDFENIDEEKIEIKGIPTGIQSAGVGFIIIPREADIDEYKDDVMRSGKVSIYGGLGYGYFHNVPVDRDVIQRIRFPENQGEYGSPVVWVNIPKHNIPVIIAILKNEEDYHPLTENQKRITKTNDKGDLVDIDMNPEQNRLTITVNGNKEDLRPKIIFKLNGKNNDGQFIIDTNGEIILKSTDRTVLLSEKRVEIAVSGMDNVNKARLVLDSDKSKQRFIYEDDLGNEIIADDEKISLNPKESKTIILGDSEANPEFLVKGESLIEKMEEIIDAITQITVTTPSGPSGVPVNAPQFLAIKESLKTLLCKVTKSE